jgi:hypothetical protein
MALTGPDTQETRLPELDASSIKVARLPRPTALAPASPPSILEFATGKSRGGRIDLQTALVALVLIAVFVAPAIDAATSGGTHRRPAPARPTGPAQHLSAADRARAAAIAQAERDRGTDAYWEDTIPAPATAGPRH